MAYEDDHFIDTTRLVWNYSFFSSEEIQLFRDGYLFKGHEKFGNHYLSVLHAEGFYFAVWAPNATAVSVVGEFNGWKKELHPLFVRQDSSGIWEGFIPRLPEGTLYKYHITGQGGHEGFKADPYSNYHELRPGTASVTWRSKYQWEDHSWMKQRRKFNALDAPWNVYEVHLGSWMRPEKNNENLFNDYYQIAERLVPYVKGMGFTHVELMPIMEHPYDGSWGYQGTGFFAATSRYGTPDGLAHLIDLFHQNEIGVILDWVPSHFPNDAHGLYYFDGAHTYEYGDMRKGFHPDWNSYIFNYKRPEVRSFLLSSAHYWLKIFHADGLRVDAVNSIIRLDFSRKEGEWEPNEYGGNENLEAIEFLKDLNRMVYRECGHVQTIAEEASDWPGITRSLEEGGYGFGMKWMMGWMHDTLRYFKKPPPGRMAHQDTFSFSMMYFYDEHFMLPFSHDEVVHGKSPMIYKMPGDEWQQFATLRLLYVYMFTHPGARLLFMGNEFGQTSEWNMNSELDWELLKYEAHSGLQSCVKDLNFLCRQQPSLYQYQFQSKGFTWESLDQREEGILVYRRTGRNKEDDIVIMLNVSANTYYNKSIQLSGKAGWKVLMSSNAAIYWGTGEHNSIINSTSTVVRKKKVCEIFMDIHALSAIVLQ